MAYEASQIRFGNLTAGADLSSKQFYFVKLAIIFEVTLIALT